MISSEIATNSKRAIERTRVAMLCRMLVSSIVFLRRRARNTPKANIAKKKDVEGLRYFVRNEVMMENV
jgi:hypothetical protein